MTKNPFRTLFLLIFAILSSALLSSCVFEVGILPQVTPTAEHGDDAVNFDLPDQPDQNSPRGEEQEGATQSNSVELPGNGILNAKVCYPSEFIPAMTVYLQETNTMVFTEISIQENQDTFSVPLDPGSYIAYAYPDSEGENTLGGAYTEYVACGFGETCTDHMIRSFEILSGEVNEEVAICDWYAPEMVPPRPTEAQSACPQTPIAGLIYGRSDPDDQSTWQVGFCGENNYLLNLSHVVISPNGRQALYSLEDDIWMVDLLSGDQKNLTNTSDRIEVNPQWWPGRQDLVIFGSWGVSEALGPSSGYLSVVATNGSSYRVLESRPSNAVPAAEPFGSRIAYDVGGSPWFYDIDEDRTIPFNIDEFGLNVLKGLRIGSPAWSPDGRQLAWWVGGVFSPSIKGSVALAVFDLETRSVNLLHPYTPVGTGGWLPAPTWSPDGRWLAAVTLSEAHKADLWVISATGGEEDKLGYASELVWHPESRSLAYRSISEDKTYFIQIDEWEPVVVDLPPNSIPLAWHDILQVPGGDEEPHFGPDIIFATQPQLSASQLVFPYGTPQIYAIWSYENMRDGSIIHREWYLDGELWIVREEAWDFAKYGASGIIKDISIHDFEEGLPAGTFQLRLFINGQEQPLGVSGGFSNAFFEISTPNPIIPQTTPDGLKTAIVEPPGTLLLENVYGVRETLLVVDEISSLTWHPDGLHILYSVRDRSGQNPKYGNVGMSDELWIVNVVTGDTYPLADQFDQTTGMGLHSPSVSTDGGYVAAVEGTGWTDTCYVARKLWVKQLAFVDGYLRETYSYYQLSFDLPHQSETGDVYVERIVGWDSPTRLKVEFKWTCSDDKLDGIYLLDLAGLTAEKIGGSE